MLSAMVVGLGQVGMGYDLDLSPSEFVLTHTRAFHSHPEYRLVAGVDMDESRRHIFEEKYDSPAYEDVSRALTIHKPDVVAIAVPTPLHEKVLAAVLSHPPKAVLCEKPLARDLEDAQRMAEACTSAGVALFVNYPRLSEPGVLEVKRRMRAGMIRTPVKGFVWYSRGLFNNGSHFLNLLEHWLGAIVGYRVLGSKANVADDPEPELEIKFSSGTVYFVAASDEDFTHRCMELIGPSGRLRYESEGASITWTAVTCDPVFAGYRLLSTTPETIPTDWYRMVWHVVDQLANHLAGRPAAICTGADALRTLETLSAVQACLGNT